MHTLYTKPYSATKTQEHHKRWERKNERVKPQVEMLGNAVTWTCDRTHECIPSEPAQEQTSRHASMGLRRGSQGPTSRWRVIQSWWLLRRESQFSSRTWLLINESCYYGRPHTHARVDSSEWILKKKKDKEAEKGQVVGVLGRVSRERKGRYDHDKLYACIKLSINLNYPGNFKSLHNGNKISEKLPSHPSQW